MGLFSSIAGFIGAKKRKKAAKKAAAAQVGAFQQGVDEIGAVTTQGVAGLDKSLDAGLSAITGGRDTGVAALTGQNDVLRGDLDATIAAFMPFITGGQKALGAQGDLLGLGGGEAQAAAIGGLKESPLFRALFGAGQEAVLANASATGGLRGGNVQSSLAEHGASTLARVIQEQLSGLGGVAGLGLNAAGGAAQARAGAGATGAGLSGGIAELLSGAGINIAELEGRTASDIANLLAQKGINLSTLFSGQGAAKAGGIKAAAQADSEAWGHALEGVGQLAAAFLPTGGMGGTIRGLI